MFKTLQSLALVACAIFALTFQSNAQRGAAQSEAQPLKQISQDRILELHSKYFSDDNIKGVLSTAGGGFDTPGCQDESACNYDMFATSDDGSCCYEGCYDLIFGSGPMILLDQKSMVGGGPSFPGPSWLLTNNLTGETWTSDELGNNFSTTLCLTFGCYTFEVSNFTDDLDVVLAPTGGGIIPLLKNGFGGSSDVIFDVTFNVSSLNNAQFNFSLGGFGFPCEAIGCTAPSACNYDPDSFFDDGSCSFPGCLDPSACNYTPDAGCASECQYINACDDCLNENGDIDILAEIADNPSMLIEPYVNPTAGTGAFVDVNPSQWVIAGINTLDDDGGGGPILLAAAAGGGGDLGNEVNYTTVGFTATEDATYSFDWSYDTNDNPEYDPAFYAVSTPWILTPELTYLTDEDGLDEQFGTFSLELTSGEMVVFGIDPTDACCGAGFLTIESITIPGDSCSDPGNTCAGDFDGNDLVNAVDLLAFLAVYGLVCSN